MMQVGVQSCGPKLPILKDFELTQSGEGRTSCVGHRKRPGRWMLPSILATLEVLYWMPVVRLWGWWWGLVAERKVANDFFHSRRDEPDATSIAFAQKSHDVKPCGCCHHNMCS